MTDLSTLNAHARNITDLVRWKTEAWLDPGMVKWYSGRMVENESTNRLKNALEINAIKRFVRGAKIIDIGTGTGRAALPLIASGYALTGIDSSQAMLDELKRLAGNLPIVLKAGDLFDLPCGDHSFDCAVALNVLVHFSNWRESLREWQRVVRPGGRLIFDIHSLDHVTAAYGRDSAFWPPSLKRTCEPENFTDYVSRISVDDLVSFANEAGFSIAAVLPYGAFLGGGNINWLQYEELESTHKWKRVLSWFARDQGLLDLGLFLEEALISRLTPRITGRMFVILDNKRDEAGNARFAADLKARDQALDQRDFAALAPWLPMKIEAYAGQFERLLAPLRSRHFFFLLYRSLLARAPGFDFRGALPEATQRQMTEWMRMGSIDRQAVEIARNWCAAGEFRMQSGVDVSLGVEYFLVRDLLSKYFGLFSGDPR
jgi:SAM-dependent methyltransferase